MDIAAYSAGQLCEWLQTDMSRARELHALAVFQNIPSIGLKFAEDLVEMGFYALDELKHHQGAALLNAHEKLKGYFTDPCVEDQFRLVVHFANYQDYSKTWWDFTPERKAYRAEHGYPADRPTHTWTDAYAQAGGRP